MSLSIIPINQIFGRYEQQTRIAELNKKTPIKTVQRQVDRVTISPEARQAQVTGVAPERSEVSKPLFTASKDTPKQKPSSSETKPTSDTEFEPMSFTETDEEISQT